MYFEPGSPRAPTSHSAGTLSLTPAVHAALQALANEGRVAVLATLAAAGEMYAQEVVAATGLPQPTVAGHRPNFVLRRHEGVTRPLAPSRAGRSLQGHRSGSGDPQPASRVPTVRFMARVCRDKPTPSLGGVDGRLARRGSGAGARASVGVTGLGGLGAHALPVLLARAHSAPVAVRPLMGATRPRRLSAG